MVFPFEFTDHLPLSTSNKQDVCHYQLNRIYSSLPSQHVMSVRCVVGVGMSVSFPCADLQGEWDTQRPGAYTRILQRWGVHSWPHHNDVQTH